MSEEGTAQFRRRVYEIVAAIPPGRVMSYGQIALIAGFPGHARHVGAAMKHAPQGLPCHRVVNSAGRTAPGFTAQRPRLEKEGVTFSKSGNVNMKKHRIW